MPATKTFLAELAAFALIAEALGAVPWEDADLEALPDHLAALLDDPGPARAAARLVGDADGMVAVGRGFQFAIALEPR